jgi:hypothetical protein
MGAVVASRGFMIAGYLAAGLTAFGMSAIKIQ